MSPAAAADLYPAVERVNPARQAVVVPARRLSCYAGVLAEVVISHPEFANVPVAGAYSEYYALGGRGGGLIGCDILFQTKTFLGLEATGAWGQLKGRHAVGLEGNLPGEATARLRFGYFLDPDVSVFVAGGVAIGYLKTTDATGATTSGQVVGGQVGTGIEYRFLPSWRARFEYAYTYYGSDSILITGFPLARMNPTSHTLRGSLLWVWE